MRELSGGKLRTVVADHGIRAPVPGKVVLQLGNHSSRISAGKLVNFPKFAVVIDSDEKLFAFVREQVSSDSLPRSYWYFRALQCFLWLRAVVLPTRFT